ncbi:HNH endonuclease [Massilia cavernae]|uniref:HNH endonuclease n=1 Tax=Massilia cavernae TaxID=2320864 RepID=A0A418XE55_9BURK|nr:HNH endonuclease signature motif containing protein [Massilia cavernae]RJG10687.1 HNH endonuclease [Massilia cavernae]
MDLISAYDGRCAITQCPIRPILEAAHVTPYLGPQTNAISNGLLLRADIHTLWDLRLIAIDPNLMTVCISPTLQDPSYQVLAGKSAYQPAVPASRVSPLALERQWELFQTRLSKDI